MMKKFYDIFRSFDKKQPDRQATGRDNCALHRFVCGRAIKIEGRDGRWEWWWGSDDCAEL